MRRLAALREGFPTEPTPADVAFARKMIPHHQLALEMSREVLARGRDQFTRDLASNIIVAQQAEIDIMRTWLRRVGASEDAGDS